MMPFSGVRISWRGHREEARLGAVGGIGVIAGLAERALGLGAVGDVAADALHLRRCPASVRTRPSRQAIQRGPSAVAIFWSWIRVPLVSSAVSPCSSTFSAKRLPISFSRGSSGQFAIGVVDEGDAAVAVAQHDQVALRFEQAAGALLGLLQFPVAVGQRFVVQRDLAHLLPHPAQPEAQRRQRDAGEREQEAGADRKGVRDRSRNPRPGCRR